MAGETGGIPGAGAHADPGIGMEPGGVRFLFRSFKRILALNTRSLELMARMDRALGGEYVFDRAFLDSSVRDICRLTHQAAYHLNGMDGEESVALYDAVLAVKDALDDILSGGMGGLERREALPFSELGLELEPLAGLCAVGLACLRRMGLPAPQGFAVTATGMGLLAGPETAASASALETVRGQAAGLGASGALELTFNAAGQGPGHGRVLSEALARNAEEAARLVAEFARAHAAPAGRGELAACVRRAVPGQVRGTLQTLAHDPSLPPAMLAVAEPAPGQEPHARPGDGGTRTRSDRVWISRSAPHTPLRSRISAKPLLAALPGGRPLDLGAGARQRGSGWLSPALLSELAETGLAAERALDAPCVLSWTLGGDGKMWVTGVEPAEAAFPEWAEEDGAPDGSAPGDGEFPAEAPLLAGGQIACGGVGAGPVVRVDDLTAPRDVPLGSVGVTHAATPALSRVVPRLGALLARVGTPASHLATVAREHRVPAIFGLKGAPDLAPGTMVTVDAEQGAVFAGVAEGLLRQAAVERARSGAAPEYQSLRRLLRHIRPLNLVDPEGANFRPEGCRTCHDVIHYAHEKAVELLLSMDPASRGGLGQPRRLAEDSPFELRVVDLGGALATPSGDVALEHVSSRPLRAFLEGLLLRETRRNGPARISLGDILSGLGRTGAALSAPAESTGLNLALAAPDYANITLRLGYHFSVVDAAATPRPEQNFVYFRFAGGFADGDRRARRAGLIERVLGRLGFRATRKGDLVVGRRKLLEEADVLASLRLLGALSTFTRQLDVELAAEEDVERLALEFLEACGRAGLCGELGGELDGELDGGLEPGAPEADS